MARFRLRIALSQAFVLARRHGQSHPGGRRLWVATVLALLLIDVVSPASAAVVILANRTKSEVPFTVNPRGKKPRTYRLAAGDLMPVPVLAPVEIAYTSDGNPRGFVLEPCAICIFMETKLGGVDMQQVGLGAGMIPPIDPKLTLPAEVNAASGKGIGKVPVRVLIDDDERTPETVWKPRLTDRLKKASEIFTKYCRMQFEIVEFGSWDSDDSIVDFNQSLHEFEKETTPPEGGIVIGFMSHLILDEIWSIRFRAGIPVGLKSSSGTAIKFWGDKTLPNLFTWACVGVLTFLSIDGRVYQGDVAPFVRIIETGGSSIVGTSEPKDEWRPSYGRTDVDAAQRKNPAWNR